MVGLRDRNYEYQGDLSGRHLLANVASTVLRYTLAPSKCISASTRE